MIERADGSWRNGKWADFDPVRPPDIIESNVANDPAWERSAAMKACRGRTGRSLTRPPTLRHMQEGRWGYILAWLVGVPVPILILIYLLRGCT